MLIIAAWIKLSSPGPVFFLQDRVGWHGRIFRPFKFRTMRAGRQPDPQELVPLEHGDITRVGRILRRIKLDELPQLINVVRGEMSLVGPRPTLPDQAAAYDEFRRQRLLLRPGMTGLAQVHGSTAIAWNQRILFDVAYVRRCGFFLDMRILLRTLLVLLAGETRFARRFETTRYARFVSPPANYEESGQEPHLQAAHRG
jgi:lipopolysaccharide/colanic/teichoic acid biosynthesis glycosyltransferase